MAQRGAPVDAESQHSSIGSERIAAHRRMRVHAFGRHGVPLREEIGDAGLRKRAGSARASRLWMRAGCFDRKGVSGAQKTGRSSSARNLRFFCVYPLGFIVRRSYDGGLPIFRRELRFVTERSESDEDACIGAPGVTFGVREGVIARCGVDEGLGAYQSGAGEENENNLRSALDKGSMHPHNR